MLDANNSSIFDKENRGFLVMSLIEWAILIGTVIGACLGK